MEGIITDRPSPDFRSADIKYFIVGVITVVKKRCTKPAKTVTAFF